MARECPAKVEAGFLGAYRVVRPAPRSNAWRSPLVDLTRICRLRASSGKPTPKPSDGIFDAPIPESSARRPRRQGSVSFPRLRLRPPSALDSSVAGEPKRLSPRAPAIPSSAFPQPTAWTPDVPLLFPEEAAHPRLHPAPAKIGLRPPASSSPPNCFQTTSWSI